MGNLYNKAGDAQSIKFGAALLQFGKPDGQTIVGYSDQGGEISFKGEGLIYKPVDSYFPVKVFPTGMMVKVSVNFAEWKGEQVALGLGMNRGSLVRSSSAGKVLEVLPFSAENLHHMISGSEYWLKILIPNEDNPLLAEEIFLGKVARDPETEVKRTFKKEVASYEATYVALEAQNIPLPNGGTLARGLGYWADEKPADLTDFAAIVLPTSAYSFADTRVNEYLLNTFLVQNNGTGDLLITGAALKTVLKKGVVSNVTFSTNTTITISDATGTLNQYQNKKLLIAGNSYTIASNTATSGGSVNIVINTVDLTSIIAIGDTGYVVDTSDYSAGDFELVSGFGTVNVPAGGQHAIVAKFVPQSAADDKTCVIQISSNDADDPEVVIELEGDGTAAGAGTGTLQFLYGGVSQTTINYGNVVKGVTTTRTIKLYNAGTGVITVSNVALTTGTVFKVATGKTSGFTIAIGSSEDIVVQFTPTTLGVVSDTLTVTSNASNPSASLTLSGTGVNASDNPNA